MTQEERRKQLFLTDNLEQDRFMLSVRDRILRDHKNGVILNHCPKCNALARTPVARQCPKCFHSWREGD